MLYIEFWRKDESCVRLMVLSERNAIDVQYLKPLPMQSFPELFQTVTKQGTKDGTQLRAKLLFENPLTC